MDLSQNKGLIQMLPLVIEEVHTDTTWQPKAPPHGSISSALSKFLTQTANDWPDDSVFDLAVLLCTTWI